MSTAAIGANCWLLQAKRHASSRRRFRRRAGVVLGHTRELVQYDALPKVRERDYKDHTSYHCGSALLFIFSRTKTFEWLSGARHGRLWHLGFRDVLRRV